VSELTGKGADLLAQTLKGTTDDLHEWLLAKHREALLDGIAMGKEVERSRVVALAKDLAEHCQPAERDILLDLARIIGDYRDRDPRTPPPK
jgi:hypothetical protein